MLADSSEPAEIVSELRALRHPLPKALGVDYMWADPAYGAAGVQRKTFPVDLRASLPDGRLAMQLHQQAPLHRVALILEGLMPWWHSRVGIDQVRLQGLLMSLQGRHGITVAWTTDPLNTVAWIRQWQTWLQGAEGAGSLRNRPKRPDGWGDPCSRDRRIWFLAALPGIGTELAGRIIDHCQGGLPLRWTGPPLESIKGIGPKRAAWIRTFLTGEGERRPVDVQDQGRADDAPDEGTAVGDPGLGV